MALERCPDCGGPLPIGANRCPHCGATGRGSGPVLLWGGFILLLLALYLLFR
jgi:hypothetical protein